MAMARDNDDDVACVTLLGKRMLPHLWHSSISAAKKLYVECVGCDKRSQIEQIDSLAVYKLR